MDACLSAPRSPFILEKLITNSEHSYNLARLLLPLHSLAVAPVGSVAGGSLPHRRAEQ